MEVKIRHEGLSHQYFYSEESEAYIADIPDLRYCSAHSETPEEALAVLREDGKPIPEPRYRPAIYQITM